MNADAWKKRLLLHLPYGVIGLAAAKLSEAWRLSAGTDFPRNSCTCGMARQWRSETDCPALCPLTC